LGFLFTSQAAGNALPAEVEPPEESIQGPYQDPPEAYPHAAAVSPGGVAEYADRPATGADYPEYAPEPLRYTPGTNPKPFVPQLADWLDSVAQSEAGAGNMPVPDAGFAGLNFFQDGAGWPPDTVGDIGPEHYVQAVNISIGIYTLDTGAFYRTTFNNFFTGPADTPCVGNHRGDPVVLYDPFVERWLVSDFAWYPDQSSFYQCLAVSKSADAMGGWYFYGLRADTGDFKNYLNDYPKLGAWHDGWYLTANMFEMVFPGRFGVRAWALDRERMIQGLPLREVHFDLCTQNDCASLLPAHDNLGTGSAPAPNYLLAALWPDELLLWRFDANFDSPLASTFSGPSRIPVATFATASQVPQAEDYTSLDSLSSRLMMQLQYQNRAGVEALYANHTVASSGRAAVRWYEIQQPDSPSPVLAQQGTYQPDGAAGALHRWMGSLAVDQDGNLALGYSVSGGGMYPSIRVAGRLAGEIGGQLPQDELEVVSGAGFQTYTYRWGDYSAMSVAPDGCTFYYTNQYFSQTGYDWQTWVTPFRYPSCGQPKGTLNGQVLDAVSRLPLAEVEVRAVGPAQTVTVQTDAAGAFTFDLLAGEYSLSAGPRLPGYPQVGTGTATVTVDTTTTLELYLQPYPALELEAWALEELPAGDNNQNGYAEPGETGLLLWFDLRNAGAAVAQTVNSQLSSLTAGVQLFNDASGYADILPGAVERNSLPYVFSLDESLPCGSALKFEQFVTDNLLSYSHAASLQAAVPASREVLFTHTAEQGYLLWRDSEPSDAWDIIAAADAPSPPFAWTDSPLTNYRNYDENNLVSPDFNLSGKNGVQVSFAIRYALETAYDYLYLDYSLDGGASWAPEPLLSLTGFNMSWTNMVVDASVLDGSPSVRLRFRLLTDASVVYDGVTLDDIAITYAPTQCEFALNLPPAVPVPLSPMAGELFHGLAPQEVTFRWRQGASGAAVDGYRLFVNGAQVAILPGSQTTFTLDLPPGMYTWEVQAYNSFGESAQSPPTRFWQPFVYWSAMFFR
jgi:hypothetical protein